MHTPIDWPALVRQAAAEAGLVTRFLLLPLPLALVRLIYDWFRRRRPNPA